MKTCFRCAESKPLSNFYAHKMMADGHLGKCKDCTKADVAAHREENIEKIRAYDRRRSVGARKDRSRAYASAWIKNHPEEVGAQRRLAYAVRTKKMQRSPCEFCGSTPTVGHHDDYAKPLDVRWLCDPCHKSHHARLRGKTPWRLISLGIVK